MSQGRVHGDPAIARSNRVARSIIAVAALTSLLATLGLAGSAAASEDDRWADRINVKGDFRARDEVFIREGEKDRHRLRYRLRIAAESEINEHVDFGLRLSTGPDANSGNQSLGSGVDFDPDGIFLDKAFITLKPHGAEKPMFGDSKSITFGKMGNPFKDKKMGPSPILWDGDHTPEGAAFQWGWAPCDCWDTNLDVAYFVIDEENLDPSRDPAVFGVQVDNDIEITDGVTGKVQATYYAFRKLNPDFITRGMDAGNVALTDDNHVDLIDVAASTSFTPIEDWPVTVWGNFVQNLSAEGTGEGKQGTAFSVGVNLGSKKAIAEVGVGYFQVEADAVPGNLTDSDFLDGVTNGEAWRVHATKTVLKNTDFNVIAYISDELDDDVSALQGATPGDRVRIQTNVVVKF